jgi:cytochrome c-type biogenesis protein CcmE
MRRGALHNPPDFERTSEHVNKRARNRLIGVTILILVAAVPIFYYLMMSGGSYVQSVGDVAANAALIGQRVKVTGSVVAGSWDKKTNPMVFRIRGEGATGGPEIQVVYNGSAPNTFGNDTVAILTGTVAKAGLIEANEMLTKCPSKYSTKSDAATISSLLAAPPDAPIRVTGFLAPGSLKDASAAERFVLSDKADGNGPEVPVAFQGSMPAGATDGSDLVVFGKMESGVFVATEVALAAK